LNHYVLPRKYKLFHAEDLSPLSNYKIASRGRNLPHRNCFLRRFSEKEGEQKGGGGGEESLKRSYKRAPAKAIGAAKATFVSKEAAPTNQ
jgi:hypothetical protein